VADQLQQSLEVVHAAAGGAPFDLAVVLGSGLGDVADALEITSRIPFGCLPILPPGAVSGHAGVLCCARFDNRRILVFQGRFHCYQGLSAAQVAQPVVLAHALGCRRLLLTNASGGIHPDLRPGDFLQVIDHLNFLGDNPLRGRSEPCFLDLSGIYDRSAFPVLERTAQPLGCRIRQGVLAAMSGPSYETPAEIRALQRLGADAVSMSTIPEAIMAHSLGLRTLALATIANRAAGLDNAALSHAEVLACGRAAAGHLQQLLLALLGFWYPEEPR